jgi:UDP-glucuronate 4-epimerase
MKSKKILVTGHAGFIGSSLTLRLLRDGYKVVGIDNYNDYYDVVAKEQNVREFKNNSGFVEYRGDIRDKELLKKVFKEQQIGTIIHLAARAGVRPSLLNPELYHEVNVGGTINLLKVAKKNRVSQFIFASSSSVYGNQEKTPFSETDELEEPVSPYAETKMIAEKSCSHFAKETGMATTILRFFTVYGPKGRPDMAPFLFCYKALKGLPVTKFGDGSSSRDYTYIDDIVEGIILSVKNPFDLEIINLGNNTPVSLNQFISLVEKVTGKKLKIISRPRHPADVVKTYADITKAKELLGWKPKVSLNEGLKNLVNWLSS